MSEVKDESPEEKLSKEAAKIAAAYEENIKTMEALFNDSPILKGKAKLSASTRGTLMTELFAEEEEEAGKQFKIKAKELIKSKLAFDKFVVQKTKEFQDAVTEKKKEFNKEMKTCFDLLEAVDKMKADFAASKV